MSKNLKLIKPRTTLIKPRLKLVIPQTKLIKPRIIIDSLENSQYKWRTSRGIAKALGVKEVIIESEPKNLNNICSIVVGKNRNNKNIYSTIKKYETENFMTKLIDTSRGEIIR